MVVQREFSKIVVLVHPLFSLYNWPAWINPTSKSVRAGTNFLLGLWGRELKKIESDPETIVIILKAATESGSAMYALSQLQKKKIKPSLDWGEQKFERFERFIEKRFGDRVIILNPKKVGKVPSLIKGRPPDYSGDRSATLKEVDLKDILKKRGFHPTGQLSGRLFGEYFSSCVSIERDHLRDAFSIPVSKVERVKELSLHSPTRRPLGDDTQTLGGRYEFAKLRAKLNRRRGRKRI